MSNQMGKVVPFALSAVRMRRGAEEHRRRGRQLEATELLRRAAQQEDSPLGWLHLAAHLRRLGCWEQAVEILYRLLGRETVLPETWLELGRCHWALGKNEHAADCLYHYLAEDPYSDAAEDARSILDEVEKWDDVPEKARLSGLMRRALTACRDGETALGMRRLRRAGKAARHPGKVYITMALVLLAQEDTNGALRMLAKACQCEDEALRASTMLAVALSAAGKKRAARAMLRQCSERCDTPQGEEMYLTAAWTMGVSPEAFLHKRLQQHPLRIGLMHPMAEVMWRKGDVQRAEQWWHRILQVDPDDLRAQALLRFVHEQPDRPLPPAGMLPAQAVQGMLITVEGALKQGMYPDEMLRQGSEVRAALDQCFAMTDERIQQLALEAITRQDTPMVRQTLRELLVSPRTVPDVRQKAMLILTGWGENGPMHVLLGPKVTTAECTAVKQRKGLWRAFLGQLMTELEHRELAEEIVAFAADVWPALTRRQRLLAVGQHGYLWVKGMEISVLLSIGEEASAMNMVRDLMVSRRKLGRVLRVLAGHMEQPVM